MTKGLVGNLTTLKGIAVSPGIIIGKARLAHEGNQRADRQGGWRLQRDGETDQFSLPQ